MDRFVCYEHYNSMDPKCSLCPDNHECALFTLARKEKPKDKAKEEEK